MEIKPEYFTKDLYQKLLKGAARYKPKADKKIFDTYPYFIKYRRKLRTTDDLIVAISIAYSWMPTMLDIYDQSEKSFEKLKKEILKLNKIQSADVLEKRETEVKSILSKLSKASNNSVVGASKVLHMFYPLQVPIFDSRVITAWNKLFGNKAHIPNLNPKNQVPYFYNYWLGILYWKDTLHHSGVRKIEKKLFDFGGYLRARQKKKKNEPGNCLYI